MKLTKQQEGETIGLEQISKENQELRDAIKSRTAELENKNRELEIEAAVERVRAESMAMHNTADFEKVTKQLLKQVKELHIEGFTGASIGLIDENHYISWWDFSSPGNVGDPKSEISGYDGNRYEILGREILNQWLEGKDYHVSDYNLKKLKAAVKEWEEINVNVANEFKKAIAEGKLTHQWNPWARLSNGILAFDMIKSPDDDVKKITLKMAGAFEQAYTRFLDLKKAEKQAYESKVEASLERVRGMAAAMNHSDDLMQIAEEMFKELEILKINPLRYGLGMINGDKKEAELWASTVDDGRYLDMLGTLSLTWHPMLNQVLDAWDAQHEELIYELKGKELSDYYRKIGQVISDIPNLKELQDPNTDIEQFVSFFPFKTGALYAFTDGEPGEEGKSILKRFANVFEQAHIRYEDLQTAEKHARLIRDERDRLEIALKELRATKDQLVQQEKLASLGQLTAGIAHEIKNPLNFVNNFSELSVELIDEAREELSAFSRQLSAVKGDDATQVDEALGILDDIEMNLKKIHEHGTRADSIVKSMLEHSRGGSGKREPTDLNALVKEFTNLSFHGMRASKNPINVDMEFELDEDIGKVPLVGEDFSRVIVNLCNNAFDAMREKEKLTADSRQLSAEQDQRYEPRLTIRTTKNNTTITIEIEDNGPGIPEEIKDKILQPFFTTKKGTQGTGLGLSITNDIIKAHSDDLEIKTVEGNGSVFVISLPFV